MELEAVAATPENAIRDLSGLNHLPSGRFAANGAWSYRRWPTTWPAADAGG